MKALLKDLREACSLKRSHGSLTEATYVASLAKRLGPTMIDGAGNLHFDRREGHSRTLFVAHTDTVATGEGANPIVYDGDWWCSAPNSTLGADDGAGIALLLHLMRNKVPGYYIFCRCEERGGDGSRYIASEHEELLEQFDRAIAFDRKGVSSVITHQGSRCCSDEFGEALAEALSTDELLYATDPTGVFTDTANFTEYIAECTNISCAYEKEHSDKERLNVRHLKMLAQQIVQIDWEALPTKRDPTVRGAYTWKGLNSWNPNTYDDTSVYMKDDTYYIKDDKDFTNELWCALDLAEDGYCTELGEIICKQYTTVRRIDKFPDANYYSGELAKGADPYEILDEIYWGLR